jgi:hypothetical protein
MKCPKCGNDNQADYQFCGGCGTSLSVSMSRRNDVPSDGDPYKPTANMLAETNRGSTSSVLLFLVGFASIFTALRSTFLAYQSHLACDRNFIPRGSLSNPLTPLMCEDDLVILIWWWVGAGLAVLALILFFVVVMRRGNHIKRESIFLVALMFVVAGSCVINIDQVQEEVVTHESKRESARLEFCESKLPGLSDRVSEEPSNLIAILELADHQREYCVDFEEGANPWAIASARENWGTIVDIYEAKKEPSGEDKYAYHEALEGLGGSLGWVRRQMAEEKGCVTVIEAGLDFDQEQQRMREIEKCTEPIGNDIEKMSRELRSKIEAIYD